MLSKNGDSFMDKQYALLVDNEFGTRNALQDILHRHGIETVCAISSSDALRLFMAREFCLVIMDIHTKDVNGIEMLRFMKDSKTTPILVLSHIQKDEVVHILHAGADACLAKPVDVDLCVAQALSLIRLHETARDPRCFGIPVEFGLEVKIDPASHKAFIGGEALELTNLEFDALYYLAVNSRLVIRYEQIYRQVWGPGPASMDAVKACIKELRKKILASETRTVTIRNVRGVGYQFVYIN